MMTLRSFRLNIIVRVVVLFALVLALVLVLLNTQWRATPLVCVILIAISVANLIYYVERTNRDLSQFLDSIYYQDFATTVFPKQQGRSFQQLAHAYDLIIQSFRRITYQKEEYLSLLEAVVDRLQVGILCIDDNDNIRLLNTMAKKLFKTPHIHHLDGLQRVDPLVYNCVTRLIPGEQQLLSATIKGDKVSLAVNNGEFRVGDSNYRLYSFQNIRDELEQKEADAWQKLIRVLSHEIMNSATPILSLSTSIKRMLTEANERYENLATLPVDRRQDLLRSLDSIESRSKGLINFVDAYRGLTHIPEPQIVSADLNQVVHKAVQLMEPALNEAGIDIAIKTVGKELPVRVDPQQIEQVLINLIQNVIEARPQDRPARITLATYTNSLGRPTATVEDNGCGIAEENLANIFMPFYTTKAQGTGVGLSISRQILFMNRGLLTAESTAGEGSRFILEFGR